MKTTLLTIVFATAFAISSFAQPSDQMDPERMEDIRKKLEETAARLGVTEEQKQALIPVMQSSAQQAMAIMQSDKNRFAKFRELQKMRANADKQLSQILNPDQMAKLSKIRDERRKEMMANRGQADTPF